MLQPDQYLAWDTAFGVYSDPDLADFVVAANGYGTLHSRILVRYDLPTTISVFDATRVLRVDTLPRFIGGSIFMLVDTIASTPPAYVDVYRSTESWDRESTTWTLRVDTSGVQLPWTEAGARSKGAGGSSRTSRAMISANC